MEDPTESVEDWKLPDPPMEIEALRTEVRTLQIYAKTLSQNYAATWREIAAIRKKLQDLGL
jgi:hypothetical protein